MPRRNYYEIIDKLSFDPMEIKDKKIIDAIDLWKLLEEKRGITNEEANGEQRQQELDMYDDIKACLTDKERRKAEADAMKEKQIAKLTLLINLIKEGSKKLTIGNARIFSIAKVLRLDKEKTVKKAFVDAGFEIVVRKSENIARDVLLSNYLAKSIAEKTVRLSGISSKDYPWLDQVKNLYDLAAYFKNDGEHAEDYQHKSAEELKSIMEAGSASTAGKLDTLNKCFYDLFSVGSTQIFKDEKTKIKYDNFLKIEKYTELFNILKELPTELINDPVIAETSIRRLQLDFPDCDVALNIYNYMTGNLMNPYEPKNIGLDCFTIDAVISMLKKLKDE